MYKLIENITKELEQIGNQGVNTNNLAMLGELTDIQKDLYEIEKMKKEQEGGHMRDYGRDDYYERDRYRDSYRDGGRDYGRGYVDYERDYGYPTQYPLRRRYAGDDRMAEHLEHIHDGVERYQEGRERYRHGENEERMYDGLERLMYGICKLVETTMDLAETPRAKEIIRKHVQKMKDI